MVGNERVGLRRNVRQRDGADMSALFVFVVLALHTDKRGLKAVKVKHAFFGATHCKKLRFML